METNLYPVYSWPPLYGPYAILHHATIPAAWPADQPRRWKLAAAACLAHHLPHLLPVSRRIDEHPLGFGSPCWSSKSCGSRITRPATSPGCVNILAPYSHHDRATERESNWFVERCTLVVSRCGSGVWTPDASDGGRDGHVYRNCEEAAKTCVLFYHCQVISFFYWFFKQNY